VIITDGTERIRIDRSQRVGIGTNTPQNLLHIEGTGSQLRLEDGNEAVGRVLTSDAIGDVSWRDFPGLIEEDQDWEFSQPLSEGLDGVITRSGSVGIGGAFDGTLSPRYMLDVWNGANTGTTIGIGPNVIIEDGDNVIYFNSEVFPTDNDDFTLGDDDDRWDTLFSVNGVNGTSDENVKENITNLPYGITELMKLRPISYYWKSEKVNNIEVPADLRQIRYGFIAQELDKVIPEVVHKDGYESKNEENLNDFEYKKYNRMGVNYSALISLLVKAEQEQLERIEKLVKENKEMISTSFYMILKM